MQDFLFKLIHNIINENAIHSYIFFFFSGILQLIFPPFPSDVIIVFEGYLTTIGSKFYFFPVLAVSVLGSLIGSIFVYIFGYKKGNEVLRYKLVSKFVDKKHLKRTEKILKKYGKYGLILSKFIPGTSSIMLLLSGVFRIKGKIYFLYILLSILLQQIIYLLIGRVIGHNIDKVNEFFSIFNLAGAVVFVILVIIGYFIYKNKKVKKSKKIEEENNS